MAYSPENVLGMPVCLESLLFQPAAPWCPPRLASAGCFSRQSRHAGASMQGLVLRVSLRAGAAGTKGWAEGQGNRKECFLLELGGLLKMVVLMGSLVLLILLPGWACLVFPSPVSLPYLS